MSRPLFVLAALLGGAGLAAAQAPAEAPPPPPPPALDGSAAPEVPALAADAGPARGERFWAVGEYLNWFIQDAPLHAPIATTGGLGGQGVLGATGTQGILGNSNPDYGAFSGFRLTTGFWFGDHSPFGAEASGFLLEQQVYRRSVSSTQPVGAPAVLGRPFVDPTLNNAENVRLVAFPGAFAGYVSVESAAQFGGADASGVARLWDGKWCQADLTGGFRYLGLQERLDITDGSVVQSGGVTAFLGSPVLAPASTILRDHFATRNDYYGGFVGGRVWFDCAPFFLCLGGRLGVGNVRQEVETAGTTTLTTPTGTTTTPGGFLVVPGNTGKTTRDAVCFVPEMDVKVAVRFSEKVSVFAGYGFVYMSDVARPGDQIDRVVNPTLLPTASNYGVRFGPARPAPQFNTSDFFAHGVSFGMAFAY